MSGHTAYKQRYPDTRQAAGRILPLFLKVAGPFRSAIDVGGGTGAWSAELKSLGLTRVMCVDHPEIRREELLIDECEFLACDMTQCFPDSVPSDLVVCLEFAEHLPESRAAGLVEFLTRCGEVVLFSAAIPGQPSHYHVNEQPAEFWRALFGERGFRRFDCLRPLIVHDERLPYWYRQNLYVFATPGSAAQRRLQSVPFHEIPLDFELVHRTVLRRYRATPSGKVSISRVLRRSLRRLR